MKELTVEDSKAVQLELLKEFDVFCSKNNIQYTVAFGTLLGAIRHKGYIPWDDDIDVFLIRDDYNRFVASYKETDRYRVIALENDKLWSRTSAKFYDKRTISKELCSDNLEIGLGIDIFPVDSIPENKKTREKYRKRLFFLRNLYDLKLMAWNKERSLMNNIIVVFGHILLFPVSCKKLAKSVNNYAQKYNHSDSNFLCDNIEGYEYSEPYLKESFSSFLRVPFEDIQVSIAKGYDDILTKDYGDYMQLPPLEKRVSTHRVNVYWK